MKTCGLSPRGRGNPPSSGSKLQHEGSIPAWAGQPRWVRAECLDTMVYPRVGGATSDAGAVIGTNAGLSPRGRGNRAYFAGVGACLRSIPAWAGQPQPSRAAPAERTVYPRVGGATTTVKGGTGGEDGLSPRGRGNPRCSRRPPPASRSIPAWAGQPTTASSTSWTVTVYPRVGGATRWK